MKTSRVTHSLCAIVLAAMPTTASAHAVWIGQNNGSYAIVKGEGSATHEAYDPKSVTQVSGLDADGASVPVHPMPERNHVWLMGAERAATVATTFTEGWWTEDAKGEWHNEPPTSHENFKGAGEFFTYSVAYLSSRKGDLKPVGLPLEIVPLTDPTVLSMGDKFEVQVLHDGKPLEGVSVSLDILTDWDLSAPATDDEGKTTVIVSNNGLNVLQLQHEIDTSEKKWRSLQGVLSFVANGPAEEESSLN